MRQGVIFVSVYWLTSLSAAGAPGNKQSDGIEHRVKMQTVMIEACEGPGAGVVVSEDQQWIYVLTAYHLVHDMYDQPCQGKARFYSTTNTASTTVPFETTPGANKTSDLAAIKVAKAGLATFPHHFTFSLARDPITLRRGDHLFMVGFVNESLLWFVPPEPFFFARLGATLDFGPPNNVYPGASGGPLCNADGEIVGIVVERGNQSGFAAPITTALDTFDGWNVPRSRLFVERRFPVMKPHFTEFGAAAAFPAFTGGLSADGPGASLHVSHGITRFFAATFDTTILFAKQNLSELVQTPQGLISVPELETQQAVMPSGGLQVQPLSGMPRKVLHETLGGVYIGGGLGWEYVSRSVQGNNSVNGNLSSLMVTAEAGYRWPLPRRGWGLSVSYRVYQPVRSETLERASSISLGLYTVFR
jgi:Trypsin-like peptidase domain